MRLSQMLFVTLREDPAEAEIPSHKLMLRAGYIRRIASGVFAYLPLFWLMTEPVVLFLIGKALFTRDRPGFVGIILGWRLAVQAVKTAHLWSWQEPVMSKK